MTCDGFDVYVLSALDVSEWLAARPSLCMPLEKTDFHWARGLVGPKDDKYTLTNRLPSLMSGTEPHFPTVHSVMLSLYRQAHSVQKKRRFKLAQQNVIYSSASRFVFLTHCFLCWNPSPFIIFKTWSDMKHTAPWCRPKAPHAAWLVWGGSCTEYTALEGMLLP